MGTNRNHSSQVMGFYCHLLLLSLVSYSSQETCYSINGNKCRFPFRYQGKSYSTCTFVQSPNGQPWCYTEQGKREYCQYTCHSEASSRYNRKSNKRNCSHFNCSCNHSKPCDPFLFCVTSGYLHPCPP